MKKLSALIYLTTFIFVILLLNSCSVSKVNDFTAQKYTDFKKGKSNIALKRNNLTNTETAFPMPAIITSDLSLHTPNVDLQPIKSTHTFLHETINEKAVAPHIKIAPKHKIVHRKALKFMASRFTNSPNTCSENADVELLLLVILALILPPLAVLLARGAGSEFLLSIILTILFWVPGQIYALLVVFDVI